MKFKKILPILSTGIILSSNACAFANTTNNDDSQETSLINTVKEDSNDSAEQNVQDNNDSVEQPVQDDNDQFYDYYVLNNHHIHNEGNNFEYIFEQIAGFKTFTINYANHGESTVKVIITYPNGQKSQTHYVKPGEEHGFPFINVSKGYYEVRIESINHHLNLDGYLSISEAK